MSIHETANCPQCRANGVILRGYDNIKGRPEFHCRCCDHIWTYGNDGGHFLAKAIAYMEKCGMSIPKKPKMDKDGFNLDFINRWA